MPDTYVYRSVTTGRLVTWTRYDDGVWRADDGRVGSASDEDIRNARTDDPGLLVIDVNDPATVERVARAIYGSGFLSTSQEHEGARAVLAVLAVLAMPVEGFCSCPPVADGWSTYAGDCGVSAHRNEYARPPAT